MAFTITPEVDDAHPSNAKKAELTSAYSAALNIGESCLADGPVGRVGLEVEAHCFDLADPMRRRYVPRVNDERNVRAACEVSHLRHMLPMRRVWFSGSTRHVQQHGEPTGPPST